MKVDTWAVLGRKTLPLPTDILSFLQGLADWDHVELGLACSKKIFLAEYILYF